MVIVAAVIVAEEAIQEAAVIHLLCRVMGIMGLPRQDTDLQCQWGLLARQRLLYRRVRPRTEDLAVACTNEAVGAACPCLCHPEEITEGDTEGQDMVVGPISTARWIAEEVPEAGGQAIEGR
jgi:hypothetical protein